jgi:hypothetical protein
MQQNKRLKMMAPLHHMRARESTRRQKKKKKTEKEKKKIQQVQLTYKALVDQIFLSNYKVKKTRCML